MPLSPQAAPAACLQLSLQTWSTHHLSARVSVAFADDLLPTAPSACEASRRSLSFTFSVPALGWETEWSEEMAGGEGGQRRCRGTKEMAVGADYWGPHMTPILASFHWLPVKFRIDF